MSILSAYNSIFYRSVYDYKDFIYRLLNMYTSAFNTTLDSTVVNCGFSKNVESYPKYPTNIKPINNNSGKYSVIDIYNSTTDYVDELLNIIPKDILYYKTTLDAIPNTYSDIYNDMSLQYSYHNKIKEIYPKNIFLTDLSSDGQRGNYYQYLYGVKFQGYDNTNSTIDLSDGSFLIQHFVKFLINYVYTISDEYVIQLTRHLSENSFMVDISSNIRDSFYSYIDENKRDIVDKLVRIIFKTNYSFNIPKFSDNFILSVVEKIEDFFADNIKDIFNDYMKIISSLKIHGDIISDFVGSITNMCSVDTMSQIYKDLIDDNFEQYLSTREDNIFSTTEITYTQIDTDDFKPKSFWHKVNQYNLVNYLRLVFYYKFYPDKFINIIPFIMNIYIQKEILPTNERIVDFQAFYQKLKEIKDRLDYDVLYTELNNMYTNNYVRDVFVSKEIGRFISIFVYLNIFDEFCNYDKYELFIVKFLEKLNDTLVKMRYIKSGYHYDNCDIVPFTHLKSRFQKDILNNTLFADITTQINIVLLDYIENKMNINIPNIDYIKDKTNELLTSQIQMFYQHFENLVISILSVEVTKLVLSTYEVKE